MSCGKYSKSQGIISAPSKLISISCVSMTMSPKELSDGVE
jgi:hypothetical protein